MRVCILGDIRNSEVKQILEELMQDREEVPFESADVIVVLGGDGYLLRILHRLLACGLSVPVYGLNFGTRGFLMNHVKNRPTYEGLRALIDRAESIDVIPLHLKMVTGEGKLKEGYAINEVTLVRHTPYASKIAILVDGVRRMDPVVGDGILLATPAGSTAYNLSAGGPILPLTANLLALTPINPLSPRGWNGALLLDTMTVKFIVHDSDKRAVSCTGDFSMTPNVKEVTSKMSPSHKLRLLFDKDSRLDRRILDEQFPPQNPILKPFAL